MRDEAPSRARTGQVPQDEAAILAARCEAHAIGTKGEARHGPRVAVPAEQADAFGLLDVPHTDRGVVRPHSRVYAHTQASGVACAGDADTQQRIWPMPI